ncbi:MAG: hypothetical protein IPK60_14360 [Sandaracinaceae bacterium]|nr:hypothetical protein [Sandaracinaceae bacterium]
MSAPWCVLVSAALPWLSACALSQPGISERDASTEDGPPVGTDSDQDGICDATEESVGTNPFDADTDGDGFPDDVERALNADPRMPAQPLRESVVYISEGATAPLSVMPMVRVRGMGETFSGYSASGNAVRAMGVVATDLVQAAFASDAYPRANVFRILSESERFEGVEGTTQLLFEVRLFAGAMAPRDCRRAFGLRYLVKNNEGSIYGGPSYLVVVTPDVESENYTEWCPPVSCY